MDTRSGYTAPAGERHFQVAVVGAGLVGLACALGAAQAGLRVALIGVPGRNAAQPLDGPWDQRVYAISAASRRLLRALRVWDRLDPARVAAVRDMHIFARADAPRALHFSAYEAAADALAWIIEHRELGRVLETALDYQHGIERFETDASSVRLDGSHAEVVLGEGLALTADLIVGADGKHSAVRAAAGLQANGRSYGQQGVVANFACELAHGGSALQWFTDEGIVALLPMPGKDYSLVWSAADALVPELLALSPAELAQRVEAIAGSRTGKLVPLGRARAFPLGVMTVPRIIGQRLVLVGDAAHLVHPLAGQGLNLGFQDVESLLGVLRAREGFRDCGDAVLLRRHERARAVPVMAMRTLTDGLQRLFGAQPPLVRRIRDDGMNLLQGLPVLKKALIRQAMGQ